MPARFKLWTTAALASLGTLVVAALVLPQSFRLTAFSDVSQCLLLLSGALSFLPHVLRSRGRLRLFWALMMAGIAMWFFYQLMWTYIEVWQRQEVPSLFVGDIVLFLHIVPLMAAVALRPHVPQDEYAARTGQLDFALLIVWWIYLYAFTVLPWQYAVPDEPAYGRALNSSYLALKVVFLISIAIAWGGSKGGWRSFYASLFGASLMYSASSYVANWALDRNVYYSGSLYDIPLAVSMAWVTVIGFWTRDHKPQADRNRIFSAHGVWLARLGMIAVFFLPAFAGWTLLQPSLPVRVRVFRLILTLAAALLMGIMVFTRQYLLERELVHLLHRSRDSFANLKRLQAQLTESEKLASIGQLVGGAAHELNNPITAMLGYSDLLLGTTLSSEQKDLAAGIVRQVRRAKSVVGSLLSFAAQGPAAKAPVDLNLLLKTAVKLSQPEWQALKLEVRTDLQADLSPVLGDSNQLLRVCSQIINSALDQEELNAGGWLTVATRQLDGVISITIACAGSGARVREASVPEIGGMALRACQGILEAHGGQVRSERRESGGMAIAVELPVIAAAAGAKTDISPLGIPVMWESQPSA